MVERYKCRTEYILQEANAVSHFLARRHGAYDQNGLASTSDAA